jgi:hypothetical protein
MDVVQCTDESIGGELMKWLALLLVLVTVPAWADNVPYESKALGFSATFPLPVKEAVDPDGTTTVTAEDPSGVTYMVAVANATEKTKKRTIKEQLDDGINGALIAVHGTIGGSRDIELEAPYSAKGKIPGREVEVLIKGAHSWIRFFIAPERAYMIMVFAKEGSKMPMDWPTFLYSLKIL